MRRIAHAVSRSWSREQQGQAAVRAAEAVAHVRRVRIGQLSLAIEKKDVITQGQRQLRKCDLAIRRGLMEIEAFGGK